MVFTYFLFISRHSFIYLLANMAAVNFIITTIYFHIFAITFYNENKW